MLTDAVAAVPARLRMYIVYRYLHLHAVRLHNKFLSRDMHIRSLYLLILYIQSPYSVFEITGNALLEYLLEFLANLN